MAFTEYVPKNRMRDVDEQREEDNNDDEQHQKTRWTKTLTKKDLDIFILLQKKVDIDTLSRILDVYKKSIQDNILRRTFDFHHQNSVP